MHHLTRRYGRPEVMKLDPFGEESVQRLIVGPPNTVVEKVQEAIAATGMNYLLCIFSFGNLPAQAALRSLEMFASEVMPRLKD
jgi:alkanesulfonate monooxygenase SsuD/methylene tetrahydromethanopterin reductase-like flavin-dependent oxidoreductase (luciferase family)